MISDVSVEKIVDARISSLDSGFPYVVKVAFEQCESEIVSAYKKYLTKTAPWMVSKEIESIVESAIRSSVSRIDTSPGKNEIARACLYNGLDTLYTCIPSASNYVAIDIGKVRQQSVASDKARKKSVASENVRELSPSTNVRKLYMARFPNDDLGSEINSALTLGQLYNDIWNGMDVYRAIGVTDSVVRERCFGFISESYCIPYEIVYNRWLSGSERKSCAVPKTKPRRRGVAGKGAKTIARSRSSNRKSETAKGKRKVKA